MNETLTRVSKMKIFPIIFLSFEKSNFTPELCKMKDFLEDLYPKIVPRGVSDSKVNFFVCGYGAKSFKF